MPPPASGGEGSEGDEEAAGLQAIELRAQVALVLDTLQSHGLLDEQRAAHSLVRAKSTRYGERRLKQMLHVRALEEGAAGAALQEVRATEFQRAYEVWRRRFGAPAADAREHARQHRFLAARGFDGDAIRRVLKGERPDGSDPCS
jgi:regulatory protein